MPALVIEGRDLVVGPADQETIEREPLVGEPRFMVGPIEEEWRRRQGLSDKPMLGEGVPTIKSLDYQIFELRVVLAPLLDNPGVPSADRRLVCVWCRHMFPAYPREQGHHEVHAPECPVLRKDELLGR